MSTVRDLISDALFAVGALGSGESLDASDAEMCLRRLQRLIGSWANETLLAYATIPGTMPLTSGTASYSTTLLSTGRPTTIDNLFLRLDGIDYPCDPLTEAEYNVQSYKTVAGLPAGYYYNAAYPNGTFYFYPTPNAAYVAHVSVREPLTATLTLDSVWALPEGYEGMICDALAVDCASSFGKTPAQTLLRSAAASRQRLQATNYVPEVMHTGLPGSGRYVPGYIRILGDT